MPIRPLLDGLAASLLRTHVGRRADHMPIARRHCRSHHRRVDGLCNTEVEDLTTPEPVSWIFAGFTSR